MNALGGRLLYVCCLLMINFGPSFRATSSVFYQCSFEQKSRTKCVHHIVQQEKKKNGNRSSTVQQQLSDSHSGPRRNISENIVEKFITSNSFQFWFVLSLSTDCSTKASFTYRLSKCSLEFYSLEFCFPRGHWRDWEDGK